MSLFIFNDKLDLKVATTQERICPDYLFTQHNRRFRVQTETLPPTHTSRMSRA